LSSSASTISDSHLTRHAVRGSSSALEAIFARYHQELYRYCATIVGNSADAQDAVQNTMVKVLRALPGERRQIELRPWLYRIAHNEAIEIVRHRAPLAEIDADSLAPAASAAEEAAAREGLRRVLADVAELPERQRGALVMRELAGLDFEAIGAALGTSAATARQTLYEARLGLRAMNEGREMDCAAAMRAISDGDRRLLRGRRLRAHFRSCESCRAFEAEIERRGSELALVAPLPALAAAGILQAVVGGASGTAAGGGAAAAGGGTAAAAGTAGAAAGKAALGAAALKVAAVGAAVAIGVTVAGKGDLIHIGSGNSPAAPAAKAAPSPVDATSGGAGGSAAIRAAASQPDLRDRSHHRPALAAAHRASGSAEPTSRPQHQRQVRHPLPPSTAAAPAEGSAPAAETPPRAASGRHLGQAKHEGGGRAAAGGSRGKSASPPGQAKNATAKAGPETPKAEPVHPQRQPSAPDRPPPGQAQKSPPEAAGDPPAANGEAVPPTAPVGSAGAELPSTAHGKPADEPETP
jgi:RNA polymerase sigma factor (sigma-70 family)